MKTFDFDGAIYSVKHEPKEFTLNEYNKVLSIISKNTDAFDKYYELFNHLGVPTDILDKMDIFAWKLMLSTYNTPSTEILQNNFTHNGIKYELYNKKSVLNVKQTRIIIKYIKERPMEHLQYMAAVLYVNPNENDSFSEKSIEERANIFKDNMTADYIIPSYNELLKQYFNNATA